MIYFKKNIFKSALLQIYILYNSSKVLINIILGLFKFKNKIKLSYGGSLSGNLGGTKVKITRLNKFFRNNDLNFNTLYLLSNSIYLNKFSLKLLKNSKIPIIHNQNGVFYKGWYGKGWQEKNKNMSFQYNIADYVFYQSKFSKYCAEKFLGQRDGPGEILYNAVDNKFFRRFKVKTLGSQLNILVSGKYQSHLYYSLEFVIEVLNILNKNNINACVNFAGYYDSKVIKDLVNLARRYKIFNKIKFTGSYSQEKADLIYNSADIYFYFVHQSNCPNSVIEAMSCGLPVLCSNTGGLPEIVTKESGICLNTENSWEKPFIPNKEDALIGVQKIINNYNDYSNNSIIKVAKDHNINNWINKHEKVFKRFL